MKRTLLFLAAFTSFTIALQAAPTPTPNPKRASKKIEKASGPQETIAQSANGWSYVNGEWVHPEGYKFANGKILRTTARPGKAFPKPPGKLALENAQKLIPTPNQADSAKTAAEKAAETRRKNLQPRPAPQTGTHM
ncbi:MAG: hypothetical protein QOC70_2240 [Verrucomicrobiota bacterium]|jgi:hypothetical protein